MANTFVIKNTEKLQKAKVAYEAAEKALATADAAYEAAWDTPAQKEATEAKEAMWKAYVASAYALDAAKVPQVMWVRGGDRLLCRGHVECGDLLRQVSKGQSAPFCNGGEYIAVADGVILIDGIHVRAARRGTGTLAEDSYSGGAPRALREACEMVGFPKHYVWGCSSSGATPLVFEGERVVPNFGMSGCEFFIIPAEMTNDEIFRAARKISKLSAARDHRPRDCRDLSDRRRPPRREVADGELAEPADAE